MDEANYLDIVEEVVWRCDNEQGFMVLPLRWVVERIFS